MYLNLKAEPAAMAAGQVILRARARIRNIASPKYMVGLVTSVTNVSESVGMALTVNFANSTPRRLKHDFTPHEISSYRI